jgi:hypothetical protein
MAVLTRGELRELPSRPEETTKPPSRPRRIKKRIEMEYLVTGAFHARADQWQAT